MAGDIPLYRLQQGTEKYEDRSRVVWSEIDEKKAAARQSLLVKAGICGEELDDLLNHRGYRLCELDFAANVAQGDKTRFISTLIEITGGNSDHPLPRVSDIYLEE